MYEFYEDELRKLELKDLDDVYFDIFDTRLELKEREAYMLEEKKQNTEKYEKMISFAKREFSEEDILDTIIKRMKAEYQETNKKIVETLFEIEKANKELTKSFYIVEGYEKELKSK